tara:strand:+ start:2573 stop:2971 length:399 start_codon:yes stop_codon:yes gene_type:complete
MKKHIRHIIDEIVKEKQNKLDNGPIDITSDQLWKYSGVIEPYDEDYAAVMQESHERKHFMAYYKLRVNNRNIFLLLNKRESKLIDYFYKNSNSLTIAQMSKDLKCSRNYLEDTIVKHLKIQKNDKKNTGRLP